MDPSRTLCRTAAGVAACLVVVALSPVSPAAALAAGSGQPTHVDPELPTGSGSSEHVDPALPPGSGASAGEDSSAAIGDRSEGRRTSGSSGGGEPGVAAGRTTFSVREVPLARTGFAAPSLLLLGAVSLAGGVLLLVLRRP